VGPNLALLGQFFPGYRVTLGGSFLGLAYGSLAGFLAGETLARMTNMTSFTLKAILRGRLTLGMLRRFLDEI
jgi:hypothetical protein